MDSFRFYLAKDPFGGDINFNEEALLAVHNNELADVLVRAWTSIVIVTIIQMHTLRYTQPIMAI